MESIGCALESLEWNIWRFGPGFVFPCWHVAYLMVTWVTCNFKSSTASSFLTFFSRQHMMHRTLKPTRMSPRATWLLRLMELISFGQDVIYWYLLCPLSFQWCFVWQENLFIFHLLLHHPKAWYYPHRLPRVLLCYVQAWKVFVMSACQIGYGSQFRCGLRYSKSSCSWMGGQVGWSTVIDLRSNRHNWVDIATLSWQPSSVKMFSHTAVDVLRADTFL